MARSRQSRQMKTGLLVFPSGNLVNDPDLNKPGRDSVSKVSVSVCVFVRACS